MGDPPDKSEREYRELLEFLFEQYIRPRLPELRDRWGGGPYDRFSHELARAIRAARLLRFVRTHFAYDEEVYRTFTPESLKQAVEDVRDSEQVALALMERGGFEDMLRDYGPQIAAGLKPEHLPLVDQAVLKEIGSANPEVELRLLVQEARQTFERISRYSEGQAPAMAKLEQGSELLRSAVEEFQRFRDESVKREREVPKKSRRWFKGLGQIGQGAALTIANAGLALGAFHFPISPETQTLGAITSVITGVARISNGVGDLLGE